jgi:hypothetical protein
MSPGDDGLRNLLEQLPRAEAPSIPVERLLQRLAWGRAGAVAVGLGAAAALLLALLLLRTPETPPVNLDLRLVTVGAALEPPSRDPPELNLP